MFTRKKIALFLLTTGILSFLVGIYKFNSPNALSEVTNSLTGQEVLFSEGLLTLSVVTIGMGSYLVGSLKKKRNMHSLTLDFTDKQRGRIVS